MGEEKLNVLFYLSEVVGLQTVRVLAEKLCCGM